MQSSEPSPEAQADALLLHYLSPDSDAFESCWSEAFGADVRQRRCRAKDGQLLFDRLLESAGVSPSLFPPVSPSDAFVLIVEILTSASPDHEKVTLLYYLGLEHGHRQVSDGRVASCHDAAVLADHLQIPFSTRIKAEAYWAFDHGKFNVRPHAPLPTSLTIVANCTWCSFYFICIHHCRIFVGIS